MPRIDFYSLKQGSRGNRFLLACRLIERIRDTGARVLVYCPDTEEARHLDRLLWTYRQDSFLAHGIVGKVDATLTPVLISLDGSPASETQVLVNLASEAPAFISRFERLCDLVDHDPELREAGRARYRYYREQGYALNHHEIAL